MFKNGRLNIVCVSPAPWDFPIWTNRQNIMSRVAKEHNVLYVFHPVMLRSAIKRNIRMNRRILSMVNRVNDQLSLYTPFVLPFSDKSGTIHSLNTRLSSRYLNRYLKEHGYEHFILWFYDPEAVAYLDQMKPVLACYDCVDEYSTMPGYSAPKRRNRLERLERQLIERCDLVFTTSSNLYHQKIKHNSNTRLVENVGDFEHFNRADTERFETPPDFPPFASTTIAFIGALDNYKVDFEIIDYIAERRPNWSIILIGSRMNIEEKNNPMPVRENIHYLGMKKYEELPCYLSQVDACIIPYRINDYTNNVFPLKFFEFLSTGRPVITTPLPSIMKYAEYVHMGRSKQEFLHSVEEAIRNDSEDSKNKRLDIARRNSWESRKNKLLANIVETLGDK